MILSASRHPWSLTSDYHPMKSWQYDFLLHELVSVAESFDIGYYLAERVAGEFCKGDRATTWKRMSYEPTGEAPSKTV